VRTDDDWKLIRYHVNGAETTQLFDLNDDPLEMHNLAGENRYADRLEELNRLLGQRMRELDDPCDIDRPNWGAG
jgi:arylsulfatase A-like enzyme